MAEYVPYPPVSTFTSLAGGHSSSPAVYPHPRPPRHLAIPPLTCVVRLLLPLVPPNPLFMTRLQSLTQWLEMSLIHLLATLGIRRFLPFTKPRLTSYRCINLPESRPRVLFPLNPLRQFLVQKQWSELGARTLLTRQIPLLPPLNLHPALIKTSFPRVVTLALCVKRVQAHRLTRLQLLWSMTFRVTTLLPETPLLRLVLVPAAGATTGAGNPRPLPTFLGSPIL